MMTTKNQTQLEYFMDVVLRNYCRAAEENDILCDEMEDLEGMLVVLLRENADLRFRLEEAGLPIPLSDYVTPEDLVEMEQLVEG